MPLSLSSCPALPHPQASTALQLAPVPSASGRPGIDLRTALATLAPSAGLSPGQAVQWRLYLVLDTNVLLSRSALRVLEYIRARFGPKASGRNAGSTGGGAAGADGEVAGGGLSRRRSLEDAEEQVEDDPAVAEAQRQLLQVVAVVPWTVLLELDRLKSRGGGGGDDSAGAGGVAAQARAAIHALRAGLDAKDGFFRGETMAEYREASRQYGDAAGGIVSADDRILYCCLYFKDRLQAQQQQQQQLGPEGGMDASMADVHGSGGTAAVQQTRLVLLSNDTMMRNKASGKYGGGGREGQRCVGQLSGLLAKGIRGGGLLDSWQGEKAKGRGCRQLARQVAKRRGQQSVGQLSGLLAGLLAKVWGQRFV